MKSVGVYHEAFNQLLGVDLPCGYIYQSGGFKKHVVKNHPRCVKYLDKVSDIISDPDYIGLNPKEKNSIELVKKYEDNVLLALKLDCKRGYIYTASIYNITQSKLDRHVYSGRLIKMK